MAQDFLPWSLCFLPVFTNNQEQWKLQMHAQEKHQARSFLTRMVGKVDQHTEGEWGNWSGSTVDGRNPAITSWDGAKTL